MSNVAPQMVPSKPHNYFAASKFNVRRSEQTTCSTFVPPYNQENVSYSNNQSISPSQFDSQAKNGAKSAMATKKKGKSKGDDGPDGNDVFNRNSQLFLDK